MLLRWLVNNYLREAAEGKVRKVVADVLNQPDAPKSSPPLPLSKSPPLTSDVRPLTSPPLNPEPRTLNPSSSDPRPPNPSSEFLACDAAFIFALGMESGSLVDRVEGTEVSQHPHGVERAGKLTGLEVVVVESGVGAKAAARATKAAIKFYQPKLVISAGFAGGLTDPLRRGHIVLADEIADLSGRRLPISRRPDSQAAATTRGLHVGRLLTVKEIIRHPQERRRLAAEHGAIACDMETFGVAEVCLEQNVPLVAVRVISDAVEDELPPEIERLLAQTTLAGKLGAAAGAVLNRLTAAKDLWQLREDALKASDRLAKFLVGLIEQLA